nr:MAG TPA: hypothetical protein [Caudoviricetes sp.]
MKLNTQLNTGVVLSVKLKCYARTHRPLCGGLSPTLPNRRVGHFSRF